MFPLSTKEGSPALILIPPSYYETQGLFQTWLQLELYIYQSVKDITPTTDTDTHLLLSTVG